MLLNNSVIAEIKSKTEELSLIIKELKNIGTEVIFANCDAEDYSAIRKCKPYEIVTQVRTQRTLLTRK